MFQRGAGQPRGPARDGNTPLKMEAPLRTIAHIRAHSHSKRNLALGMNLYFGERVKGVPYWEQTSRNIAERAFEHQAEWDWRLVRRFDLGGMNQRVAHAVETWAMKLTNTIQKGRAGANQGVSYGGADAETRGASLAQKVPGLISFIKEVFFTPAGDLSEFGPLAPLAEDAASL